MASFFLATHRCRHCLSWTRSSIASCPALNPAAISTTFQPESDMHIELLLRQCATQTKVHASHLLVQDSRFQLCSAFLNCKNVLYYDTEGVECIRADRDGSFLCVFTIYIYICSSGSSGLACIRYIWTRTNTEMPCLQVDHRHRLAGQASPSLLWLRRMQTLGRSLDLCKNQEA